MLRTLSFGTAIIERKEFNPISHTLAEIQWKSCSFHPKPSMFLYYLRVDRISSLKKCDSDKVNNYKRLWKIIDYSVHTKIYGAFYEETTIKSESFLVDKKM